jgi:hypothetical protein
MTDQVTPRRRAIYDIPHKQVGEIRWVDVPARPGVGAHRDPIVTTACGAEIATTLVTRINRMVKCPDCRLALADDTEAAGFWLDQLDRLIAAARNDRTRDMYTGQRDQLRERLSAVLVQHYVRYGNPGNGPFRTEPWVWKPMAERDATTKLAFGWAYAVVESEPTPPHAFHTGVGPKCAVCDQLADHPIHGGTE